MKTLFRAFRHRSFLLLWTGQTLSRIGDFLYQVALAWWVLETTGSATAMATVFIFSFTPMLLFLLAGGVEVDRLPRVPLMLASDLARAAISATITTLAFANVLEIWHVYLASLLFGFVDAFFQPAYMALVPEVVPEDDLPSANSLTSFGVQGGRIAGPGIGAALVGLGGAPLAFAIDASSFFVSALCLLPLLRLRTSRPEAAERSSVLADAREGIGLVLRSPWLWITILVLSISNVTLAGPYQVTLPFLVKDHLRADVGTLGLLYAAFPVGYILGGLWLGRLARIRHRGWLAYSTTIVAGLGMLALGLPIGLPLMLVAALLNGAALEMFSLVWTNTMQELVPNDKLGRVSSIDMLGSFALLPVGFGLTGWATNAMGPANVCILGGAITVAVAALGLLHPAIRGLD